MWGEIEEIQIPDVQIHDGTVRSGGISMFDASTILSRQMSTILRTKVAFLHFFHPLNNGMKSWKNRGEYVEEIKKSRCFGAIVHLPCSLVCIKLVTSSTPHTLTGGILLVKHGQKLWRND